jgi:hypothetical protein
VPVLAAHQSIKKAEVRPLAFALDLQLIPTLASTFSRVTDFPGEAILESEVVSFDSVFDPAGY